MEAQAPLKVLVVENSPSARMLLVDCLESDPDVGDVRTAASGEIALDVLEIWTPDVITMDINLPGIDGFETTSRILERRRIPIVVVSGHWNPDETATVFRTMEAGALAALAKPPAPTNPRFEACRRDLVEKVKLLARVRPVRRRRGKSSASFPSGLVAGMPRPRILALGGSTGAPPVVKTILAGLPRPFPVPVVVVQHISPGFTAGLARWLKETSGMEVSVVNRRRRLEPDRCYLAPDGLHISVRADLTAQLSDAAKEHSMRPAVSVLFRSLARNLPGEAVGVLLTGMGEDGAADLRAMRETGSLTIAQDRESSVVFGMPGKAVEIGAAHHVLPPEGIVQCLRSRFRGTAVPA